MVVHVSVRSVQFGREWILTSCDCFMFQLLWWPTHSWRPCWPVVTFSCLMWEIPTSTRLDAFQMLSTSHVGVNMCTKWDECFSTGRWSHILFLYMWVYQWAAWRSLWSCPQNIFSRNLKWVLLGKMTTTLCFTAKVANGAPKRWTSLVSWDSAGKSQPRHLYAHKRLTMRKSRHCMSNYRRAFKVREQL